MWSIFKIRKDLDQVIELIGHEKQRVKEYWSLSMGKNNAMKTEQKGISPLVTEIQNRLDGAEYELRQIGSGQSLHQEIISQERRIRALEEKLNKIQDCGIMCEVEVRIPNKDLPRELSPAEIKRVKRRSKAQDKFLKAWDNLCYGF